MGDADKKIGRNSLMILTVIESTRFQYPLKIYIEQTGQKSFTELGKSLKS